MRALWERIVSASLYQVHAFRLLNEHASRCVIFLPLHGVYVTCIRVARSGGAAQVGVRAEKPKAIGSVEAFLFAELRKLDEL